LAQSSESNADGQMVDRWANFLCNPARGKVLLSDTKLSRCHL